MKKCFLLLSFVLVVCQALSQEPLDIDELEDYEYEDE